jgi:transposase, IS5 family
VPSADVHDSNVFEALLDSNNSGKDIYADSAYRPQQAIESLKAQGYRVSA